MCRAPPPAGETRHRSKLASPECGSSSSAARKGGGRYTAPRRLEDWEPMSPRSPKPQPPRGPLPQQQPPLVTVSSADAQPPRTSARPKPPPPLGPPPHLAYTLSEIPAHVVAKTYNPNSAANGQGNRPKPPPPAGPPPAALRVCARTRSDTRAHQQASAASSRAGAAARWLGGGAGLRGLPLLLQPHHWQKHLRPPRWRAAIATAESQPAAAAARHGGGPRAVVF